MALAEGEVTGAAEVLIPVETSFTTLDVPLEELLEAEHAINIHLSQEEAEIYIARGEIAGVPLGDGGIAIALREQNNSGFSGTA